MNFDMMWIEKYRPKTIDEIIGQDETKTRLKGFVESKSLPHLLFAGPPGTGKHRPSLHWLQRFLEKGTYLGIYSS